MNSSKYDRSVTLQCPTCGGTRFEQDADDKRPSAEVKCAGCQALITRSELLDRNQATIRGVAREIGNEVAKDAAKEFSKRMRRIG